MKTRNLSPDPPESNHRVLEVPRAGAGDDAPANLRRVFAGRAEQGVGSAAACCPPAEKETCCAQAQKASCCAADASSCGCA